MIEIWLSELYSRFWTVNILLNKNGFIFEEVTLKMKLNILKMFKMYYESKAQISAVLVEIDVFEK